MMRQPKVGDRYKFKDIDCSFEIYKLTKNRAYVTLIKGEGRYLPDPQYPYRINDLNSSLFEYIGNFNKDSKFNELYNLLNNGN